MTRAGIRFQMQYIRDQRHDSDVIVNSPALGIGFHTLLQLENAGCRLL